MCVRRKRDFKDLFFQVPAFCQFDNYKIYLFNKRTIKI